MNIRDWKQIKTELDELRPDEDTERQRAPTTNHDASPIQRPKTDDSILKHIADALRLDDVEHP